MTKSLLAAVLILFVVMFTSVAFATGTHVPIIVKPPVVVPPPVVVAPPPPSVAVPPPSSAAAPSTQPSGGGSGPGALGWFVFGFVTSFLGNVVREHWLFCAEDDRKPRNERICYRPLRDGMPVYQ